MLYYLPKFDYLLLSIKMAGLLPAKTLLKSIYLFLPKWLCLR